MQLISYTKKKVGRDFAHPPFFCLDDTFLVWYYLATAAVLIALSAFETLSITVSQPLILWRVFRYSGLFYDSHTFLLAPLLMRIFCGKSMATVCSQFIRDDLNHGDILERFISESWRISIVRHQAGDGNIFQSIVIPSALPNSRPVV